MPKIFGVDVSPDPAAVGRPPRTEPVKPVDILPGVGCAVDTFLLGDSGRTREGRGLGFRAGLAPGPMDWLKFGRAPGPIDLLNFGIEGVDGVMDCCATARLEGSAT